MGGESVILTFFPHPRMVLFPDDHNLKLLTTLNEKIELLAATGLDHLIIYPFTPQFSRMLPVEYVRDFLVNKMRVKKLIIGYDHHFGRNREGNLDQLREYSSLYGYEVEEIPAKTLDDVNVSSTKIRMALEQGDIETVNHYLGRNFSIFGKVVPGEQVGRTIHFPTANLMIEDKLKAVPADGVYVVQVIMANQIKGGMMNIGRPTIHPEERDRTIEVHLFDFDGDIYDETLRVEFIAHLRKGQVFRSSVDLQEQLKLDKEMALNALP